MHTPNYSIHSFYSRFNRRVSVDMSESNESNSTKNTLLNCVHFIRNTSRTPHKNSIDANKLNNLSEFYLSLQKCVKGTPTKKCVTRNAILVFKHRVEIHRQPTNRRNGSLGTHDLGTFEWVINFQKKSE